MATVVSHAMRRIASTPDANYSSCGLRSEKPRLSWSQESESALSRSMRYADPWLYDSVRPHNGLLLAPALVLCSCAEYLNGTKRPSKKGPITCKKCKGTRLPLSGNDSKFGTVRCFPTSSITTTPTRAGTVRVTSSTRPSILPSNADPYDLMRRSRLTVAEKGGSQFRARSVSPVKSQGKDGRSLSVNRSKGKYSTVGRKSILECNVNPYDLMSSDEHQDSSITLLNGQRIRVRPLNLEAEEYEDVQVRKPSKSQIPKLVNNDKGKGKRQQGAKEKESECGNRFKSILKKPSTTFSDTDSERSPSPSRRSGSHFYLPLPSAPSTPRKKVQFLVENEPTTPLQNSPIEDRKFPYDPEATSAVVETWRQEDVTEEDKGIEVEELRPILCKLKRSESDRTVKEELSTNKVVFHDSMALRSNHSRMDSRIVFTDKDLERLDGIYASRFGKKRPKQPPPEPPAIKEDAHISMQDDDSYCDVEITSLASLQSLALVQSPASVKSPASIQPPASVEAPASAQAPASVQPPASVQQPASIQPLVQSPASLQPLVQSPTSLQPPVPPRKRSANKQPRVVLECESYEPVLRTSDKISIKTNYEDVDGDANKTVLQVIPTTPEVHKLKIKNEFPDAINVNTFAVSDTTLGKTSIMINGDDCYSTIKVCDEIPLYHSSVVVKDTGGLVVENKNKSSTVYITGNFVNTYNGSEVTFENCETTKEEPSNLELLQCLSDPVEAVRRNLVPHVCGKSDPPRRPKRSENRKPLTELQELSEEDKVAKFIEESFLKLRNGDIMDILYDKDVSSEHSSSTQYEIMDQGSECYTDHSNRSSITEEELNARTKFYELLAESSLVEVSESEDHHYESIKVNPDPIYEEIEIPPPLPSNPPPASLLDDLQLDKEYTTRSIFEGASKYDILSYLVDAKERGIVPPEDSYTYNFTNSDVAVEEEESKDPVETPYNRVSHLSTVSDSSEDSSLVMPCSLTDDTKIQVERNDSGVGSETSKSSLSKYRSKSDLANSLCEDCESNLECQSEDEPLICRKCVKKRTERKEIIMEIVETEEKYGRDLQIVLEEFYQPMLVAGLLTSDQLSAIFLNVEELLENSQALSERLRDAVEIAMDQGDEDLQTVNIGKLILEAAPMLHAFETYCVRQGAASLLLASLEKEKELLRIFLRVSQMENAVLRRMNLNSFLMVPVQRVTKYPLLLARLYKVTPAHHETRDQLKEAQHKIELHLNHMNSETKDVPSKLWRRISSIPGRRSSSEMDLVNIKLRKIAVDVLEWNHDEARFALEGRLLFTQPTDNNWRKGRTIKLTPVNALLVTNGKSTSSTRTDPTEETLVFSRQAGVRDAALLLVRDKNGRYSLLREPLYLDRCVIAADPAWQSYFEVQELLGKDTFIFKAEDEDQTKIWYRQLQYYAQGMGAWRKRRNALANIMINGMGLRS